MSRRANLKACGEWAFLVMVFSLAFMRPNFLVLGSTATATDLIFLVCALIFVAALAFRHASLLFDRIYVWLGLYAAALTLSALFSIDLARSLKRLPAEFYLIALAVLTVNIVRDERMLMRTLAVWLAASVVAAAVSTIAAISFFAGWQNQLTAFALHHYGTLPPGNYPRIQGTFEYPAMLCNYLTVGLMTLLVFRRNRRIGTSLFWVLLVLISTAMIFTLTPGIGGVLAGVGLWLYLGTRSSEARLASGSAIVGTVAVLVLFIIVSSLTPFGSAGPVYFSLAGYDITPTARLLAWQQAFATFAADPLFGLGLGMPVVNLPYQVPAGGWSLITDAHNVALNVAAQSGVVGLAALAAVVIAVIRRTHRAQADRSEVRSISLALGIAFLSCLVIQGLAGSFENARHLWVLIGLIVAADGIIHSQQRTEEPRA